MMNAATAYFRTFIEGGLDSFTTHAVLIGVIAVAEISLGIGIWLESPKDKGFREWVGLHTVLGGCVVSVIATVLLLIFDEGISRTQKARIDAEQSKIAAQNSKIDAQQSVIGGQNDKIIALETRIAPRDLSPEQMARIAQAIKGFAPMQFDLAMEPQLEPMSLTDKIEYSLQLAGWQEQPPDARATSFNRGNKPTVGIRSVAGVWVIYSSGSDEKFKDAAKALSDALAKENIVAPLKVTSATFPYDLENIHVWVGEKP